MIIARSHRRRTLAVLSVAVILLFTAAVGESAEEPRFLTETFSGGFKLKEPVTFYSPESLYEYINGQAVFYLSYRFTKLEHGYYEKDAATYYVDVYELGSPLSSFGSFRQQRETDAEKLEAGCEGAVTGYLATFYKGRYYVEIIPMESGDDDIAAMKQLAAQVAAKLPGDSTLPGELALFPKDGLVAGSGRYVDENLISYSFMGRGLVARYTLPGEDGEVRVFIALADDTAKAGEVYKGYREKFEKPSTVKIGGIEGLKGQEPYRGTTIIGMHNTYVFGSLDVKNEKKTLSLLEAVLANLK